MDPRNQTRTRRWHTLAIVLIVLAMTTACSSADTVGQSAVDTDDAGAATALPESPRQEVGFAEEAAPEDAAEQEPGQDPAAEGTAGEAAADAAAAPGEVPLPSTASTGERIIKEGTVTIEVDPGDFDVAFGQVIARARALGGHVSGSSSSTSDPVPDGEPLVSGQVTLRIPVRSFEDLLTSLGEAGEVVERQITSQDVTAEYTDLESRLRNLQAQERFYLGLLDRAQSVPDAIAVQQQLDDLQSQIEQTIGRLNLLEDRTAFSTLTVRITERGAVPTDLLVAEDGEGLTPYVRAAVDTLVATIGWLLVIGTFILPFLVLSAIGLGAWRLFRRPRAVPAVPQQATLPPVPTDPPANPVTVGAGRTAEGPVEH